MSSLFKRIMSKREEPGVELIVFDFDGTLVDSRELLLRIVRRHLLAFEVSLTKDLLRFFGNTPLDHYLSLTGLPREMVISVAQGINADFVKEHNRIKPCKNFRNIKDLMVRKVIVSNNDTSFIEKSLNFLGADYFEGVYGADCFLPHDKVWMIEKLRKKYGLDAQEIVYVGDKDIDVDVARNIGCFSAIITGKAAWSPRKSIIKKKPDYVLRDLSQLAGVLREINMEELAAI